MPGIGLHQAQVATFLYDVALCGGDGVADVGDGGVGNGVTYHQELPDNALVLRVCLEPVEALDSSDPTTTVMVGVSANYDAFLAATQFDDPMFTPGSVALIDAELPVKIDNSDVAVTVTTDHELTAGKFYVHIEFLPGAA